MEAPFSSICSFYEFAKKISDDLRSIAAIVTDQQKVIMGQKDEYQFCEKFLIT